MVAVVIELLSYMYIFTVNCECCGRNKPDVAVVIELP